MNILEHVVDYMVVFLHHIYIHLDRKVGNKS